MASGTEVAAVADFIAAHGRHTRLGDGEPLFFAGDRSVSVYACVSGRVRIFLTAHGGRELLVGVKEPGDHFGELSAITGRPRAASAAAMGHCTVAHLPGERFLDELEQAPTLALAVLRDLGEQLREATSRVLARNSESVAARTGHKLAELASLHQRHARNGAAVVVLDINQHELAEWVGASRESVSRALADFRRAGVLDTGRGHIDVRDVAGLGALADAT